MNRLVNALIDDGAIGAPHFMSDVEIGGRDSILITPWRHMKLTGTISLDAGVHRRGRRSGRLVSGHQCQPMLATR